jgi:hypothetical protein
LPCPSDKGFLDAAFLREIGVDVPQIMVDDYLIENRFDSNFFSSTVPHVLHPPVRADEPLLVPDRPWEMEHGLGYPGIIYDPAISRFRLYYTVSQTERRSQPGYPPGGYFLCYAESGDGIHWEKPVLGLISYGEHGDTNIVVQGEREAKVAHVHLGRPSARDGPRNIGMIPPQHLAGYPYVMYYCDGSHFLATSQDGVHWQERVSRVIANRIDCDQTIVFDPQRREFVSYVRNRLIFSGKEKEEYLGNTRLISRVSSPDLWSEWDTMPSSVLIPDAGDGQRFYAMPTFLHAGIYWGMVHHLNEEPQSMEAELVFSRDGINWKRLPGHPKVLPVRPGSSWDCGMVCTADRIIEVGDEWWLYYTGHDGYHDAKNRQGSIGLARFRKEGFVSLRAGDLDSYVVTRPIRWPGGRLVVNASTSEGGYLRARVTDQRRETVPGFSLTECEVFEGDSVRHRVEWVKGDISKLAGRVIRLEFKFRKADLYAFLASSRD